MDIKITVRRKLPICGDVAIVCNNSDYTVVWELDEEWSGYDTKTMRTVYKDGTYTDTVFTGNTVALPVVTVPGTVKIGLYAGDIRTSRAALIRAFPSVTSDGGAPAAPSEDVYNQLMELIKQMETVSPEDIAKAVEDYLTAHPAAAASMRVEGGYIQFSADGKTWENVIALADLKGAKGDPGKDGAGMNVTGATVGQIAKISAVDDNGVPTEWEPVDMPSGGETWEFIGEWTCPENTQTFLVDKDKGGNPFSLKEIAIITYSPAFTGDTTATNRGLGVYPNTGWGNYQFITSAAPTAKNNDTARYELHYIKLYGDSMRLIKRFTSQNTTTVRGILAPLNVAGDSPISFSINNEDDPFELSGTKFTGPATCIKLSGYASTAVSAGTKIKAWGVRA